MEQTTRRRPGEEDTTRRRPGEEDTTRRRLGEESPGVIFTSASKDAKSTNVNQQTKQRTGGNACNLLCDSHIPFVAHVDVENLRKDNIKLKRENFEYKNVVEELKKKDKLLEEFKKKVEFIDKMKEKAKLVDNLEVMMNCPVCLELPREGPVPVCDNGHITCSPCLRRRMELEGKERATCSTCRTPMGDARSLLAKVILESLEHRCNLDGCEAMVPFNELEQHEEQCEHRSVLCPGAGQRCMDLVAFKDVKDHVKMCQGKSSEWKNSKEGKFFTLTLNQMNTALLKWNSCVIEHDSKLFFFRCQRLDQTWRFEVVMLGTQTECQQQSVEISIEDPNQKTLNKFAYSPRPISQMIWGEYCFSVPESILSKLWTYEAAPNPKYKVKIAVNITTLS